MTKGRVLAIGSLVLACVGIACLIAGIVVMSKANSNSASGEKNAATQQKCAYSLEAKKHKLPEFFEKVQDAFFECNRHHLPPSKSGVKFSEVIEKYSPYDPSPDRLKAATDKSLELYNELTSKTIVKHKLKPRERKALAQMRHYLQTIFGTPYGGNYYTGDFLLGPSMFCVRTICREYGYAAGLLNALFSKASTVKDTKTLLDKVKAINHTFTQFKANLQYGVKAGMVRSVKACKVGVDSFIEALRMDGDNQTAQGIAYHFLGSLNIRFSSALQMQWFDETGEALNVTLKKHALKYVGEPLHELIRYLRTTYMSHCVSSDVSSGLAQLPLSHVYVNQSKTDISTHPYLPDGTPLNGSQAYKNHVLLYYTTTTLTPDEIYQTGQEMIEKLYSQILGLARENTKTVDNATAKDLFHKKLNDSSMYYAESNKIPENESNPTAHKNCNSWSKAKKNCPVRWSIMMKWFDDVNAIMSALDYRTVDMFHFVGAKHTTPNCPVTPRPNFNPNMGVPSYRAFSRTCNSPSVYLIPFFLSRPGPKFSQYSVNSHEARPGHHTQVQGNLEHFYDSCGGVIGWLNRKTSYTVFMEGWGLYAESPLISDTNVYNDKPLAKYGMLRSQLWRALRLVVDTGLHYKNLTRQEAVQYFKDYIWEDSDVVEKEITRYQSNYGQATSYMIGQQHLIKLRARAQKELGEKFNLKDFHYHLLKDGSAPLDYLTEIIEDYIRCTKNEKDDGCQDILEIGKTEEQSNMDNAKSVDSQFLDYHVTEGHY